MSGVENRTGLPVISLFSGAMGLDLGLEQAGFHVVVAVECNPYAAATIRENRKDIKLIERRIENVTTEEILDAAGLKPGEPVMVVGGPSCQVFSTAGARLSFGDPRGGLFEHFTRVVRESQPRFFVMENVRGLLSAAAKHRPLNQRGPGNPPLEPNEELGSAFRLMAAHLKEMNYYTIFDVLNSADFGTPQTRQRLLLLGSRDGEALQMPLPTHHKEGLGGLPNWKTFRQAVEGLSKDSAEFFKFGPTKEKYLAQVPDGGNWRDLPEHLKEEALGRAFTSWGGRSGFFRRLGWDKPSPTLTTKPDSKATSLCHPTELRPLSVQEYARVQEFPDNWVFQGSTRQKYEQIGNAVPLGLGKAAGSAILAAMETSALTQKKGTIECANFELLRKLTARPKTILNPARMRADKNTTSALQWYEGESLMRHDALSYAPPELREDFRKRLGLREAQSVDDPISQLGNESALVPADFGARAIAAE